MIAIGEVPSHNHTRGTMEITGEIWQDYSKGQLGGIHGSQTSYSGAFYFGNKSVTSSCTWSNYGDAKSIAFKASNSWKGSTSSSGGDGEHNNMQPYLAVYLFKRTA